ncbi:MAG TPA: hypothetical protein GXZ63_02435 [Mollicutes bacterium]|jgi:hypothetical protein|nr:hypothetical protein [Mollicutes bacterium]
MFISYYETDDWVEGNNKYYRGYAIQLLSYFHKEENKVLKKQFEKTKTNYYK